MKHKYFKPVGLYTHPAITEYEFLWAQGPTRAIKVTVGFLMVPMVMGMGLALYGMTRPIPQATPVIYKPRIYREVAPLLDDEMLLQEVHPTPIVED